MAREALCLEKAAYTSMKKKLEYVTTLLKARGEAAELEKGLLLSPTRESSGMALAQVAQQLSVVSEVMLDAFRGRVLQESM